MSFSFGRRPVLERRSIMWSSSWLRNQKRSYPGARRRTHGFARKRAAFRPQLQALEARWLLSTYYAATSHLIHDINAPSNGFAFPPLPQEPIGINHAPTLAGPLAAVSG